MAGGDLRGGRGLPDLKPVRRFKKTSHSTPLWLAPLDQLSGRNLNFFQYFIPPSFRNQRNRSAPKNRTPRCVFLRLYFHQTERRLQFSRTHFPSALCELFHFAINSISPHNLYIPFEVRRFSNFPQCSECLRISPRPQNMLTGGFEIMRLKMSTIHVTPHLKCRIGPGAESCYFLVNSGTVLTMASWGAELGTHEYPKPCSCTKNSKNKGIQKTPTI